MFFEAQSWTQEKYCNHDPGCLAAWEHDERVVKFIGFDVGEEQRRDHAIVYDMQDRKYKKEYPMIDWGWGRDECIATIKKAGLPLPGKFSCFFCPAMKRNEIRTLYHQHRDLYDRAIAIENAAKPNLITVKGLGRDWSWQEFVEADKNQMAMCWMFPGNDMTSSHSRPEKAFNMCPLKTRLKTIVLSSFPLRCQTAQNFTNLG